MRLDILKQLMKENKKTRHEVSLLSGIPIDTLNKIFAGVIKNPKYAQMEAIARAIGCTTDDFSDAMAGSKAPEDMTQDELEATIKKEGMEFVELFNQLSPQRQKALMDFVRAFVESE